MTQLWLLVLLAATAVGNVRRKNAPPSGFAECHTQIVANPQDAAGFYCVYVVARTQGRYAEARTKLEAYEKTYPDNAHLLSYYGSVLMALGDPGAPLALGRAADRAAAAGDRDGEARQRANLALINGRKLLGLPDQWPLAIEAAYLSGNPDLITMLEVSFARRLERADLTAAQALATLRWLEPVAIRSKQYMTRASWFSSWTLLMSRLGRKFEVVEGERLLLELTRRVGDSSTGDYVAMQLPLRITNDPELRAAVDADELDTMVAEALEVGKKTELRRAAAFTECIRAAVREDARQAAADYELCARDCRAAAEPVRLSEAIALQAVATSVYDPKAALALFKASVAEHSVSGIATDSMFYAALLPFKAGDIPAARAATTAWLDDLDASLRREADPLLRSGDLSRWLPHAYELSGRLLDLGDLAGALDLVERFRARALVETIETSAASPLEAAAPAARSRYEALSREIVEAQRELQEDELTDEARAGKLEQLATLEGREAEAWAEVLDASGQARVLYRPEPLEISALQAELAPGQALMSFQLARPLPVPSWWPDPPRSWLLVLTRDTQAVLPVPSRGEIDPLVDLFAGAFEQRDNSEIPLSIGLYDKLLRDAIGTLPEATRSVVLVPDGQLHRLPFAALRANEDAAPFGSEFAISTVPSVRAWLRQKKFDTSATKPAVVIADPEFIGADGAAGERNFVLATGNALGRLPLAQREAAAVARHLGPAVDIHLGLSATESLFKGASLSDYGVLHIAAHAVVDETWPERSAVLLAPGTPDQDGLLRLREIAGLDLTGTAVVLAACESASGRVVGGEGPFGLARAFFAARTRTIVASLWRLRDDEALAFFDAFYYHLAQAKTVAEAVRAAQDSRRKAGADAAGWAGIVVIGDGDLIPYTRRRAAASALARALLVALGVLGVVGLALYRRRRE